MGRHVEAIKLYEDALPIMKEKFPDHIDTLGSIVNLGLSYAALGRHRRGNQAL